MGFLAATLTVSATPLGMACKQGHMDFSYAAPERASVAAEGNLGGLLLEWSIPAEPVFALTVEPVDVGPELALTIEPVDATGFVPGCMKLEQPECARAVDYICHTEQSSRAVTVFNWRVFHEVWLC